MSEVTTEQPQQSVLKVIGSEKVQRDGKWGTNVTVQGGTIFFETEKLPSGDLMEHELHETLTGDGPIKKASYRFVPKSKE